MIREGIDLTRLYAYWDKQFVRTAKIVARWESPLSDKVVQSNYATSKIGHAGQLQHEQPKFYRALCVKALLVPIGKNNGGGAAMLALVMEVSKALKITEVTAFDIVQMTFSMNNRKCPIATKASYRNTKSKYLIT